MDDAHAADAGLDRCGDECRQLQPGFVPVEAVQVDLGLDDPAVAAQIPQHPGRHSRSQIGGFVAALEPVLQADGAVQAFPRAARSSARVLPGRAAAGPPRWTRLAGLSGRASATAEWKAARSSGSGGARRRSRLAMARRPGRTQARPSWSR